MNALTMTTSIGQAALDYAKRGWHVFPAPPGAKQGYLKAADNDGRRWGCSDDPGTVAQNFALFPHCALGIATEESGLVVLDLDRKDGVDGIDWMEGMIARNGELPDTIEATSPSGGWHIYFRAPDGVTFKTCAGEIAPGVDVRAHGGMVIAPPSAKPGRDRPYSWKNPPGLFDVAPLPSWLARLLPKKGDAQNDRPNIAIDTGIASGAWANAALSAELGRVLGASVGQRNHTLNTAAFKLGQIVAGGGLHESEVRDRLASAAAMIGLDAQEVAATISSGLQAGKQEPRYPEHRQETGIRTNFYRPDAGGEVAKRATKDKPVLDLVKGPKGRPIWCAENACQIIENAPAWSDVLAYDEFAAVTLVLRPVPGTTAPRSAFTPRPLTDTDITAAVRWFNRNGFPDATKNTTADAMQAVAAQSVISPVRHYLESLTWDGQGRVDTWLSRYCGAKDGNFTRKAGAAWLVSAVARALRPGCKADCALVLEGKQGAGKSSALKALAGEAWFFDGLHDLHSKDASAGLRGKWIIELPELSAMRRSDVEAVKAFLSRTEERYRPAYARAEVIEPRRCVFAGTTNRSDYMTDDTGGRRFWPVEVGTVCLDELTRDRDQLWGEAVARFRAGESWWLDRATEAEAQAVVATRAADDPWEADVLRVVAGLSEASTRDVFQLLEVPLDRRGKADAMRITGILTRAGWTRDGKFTQGPSRDLSRYVPTKRERNP